MRDNRHTQAIPPDVLALVQSRINELKELLFPYLLALTPAERLGMPKMGEKTARFVEKAFAFASENPNLVPPYINMTDFAEDLRDARGLWALENSARQLEALLGDTRMAAGSEAYQAALIFYQAVKMAAAQNVPGAQTIYRELKIRFPANKRRLDDSEDSA